jgi:hypothetical protein
MMTGLLANGEQDSPGAIPLNITDPDGQRNERVVVE